MRVDRDLLKSTCSKGSSLNVASWQERSHDRISIRVQIFTSSINLVMPIAPEARAVKRLLHQSIVRRENCGAEGKGGGWSKAREKERWEGKEVRSRKYGI